MSIANAIVFAAVSGATGFAIAFVFTVWLADREMAPMRDRNNAQRVENNALIEENRGLRADLKDAEREANHAALERDAILDDNLRMHQTIRRHVRSSQTEVA